MIEPLLLSVYVNQCMKRDGVGTCNVVGGPVGRNSSAHGAFEPTTLRFLWPEQAGRVDQSRPLQPEALPG